MLDTFTVLYMAHFHFCVCVHVYCFIIVKLDFRAVLHMWQGERGGLMLPLSGCFIFVLTILVQKVKVKLSQYMP